MNGIPASELRDNLSVLLENSQWFKDLVSREVQNTAYVPPSPTLVDKLQFVKQALLDLMCNNMCTDNVRVEAIRAFSKCTEPLLRDTIQLRVSNTPPTGVSFDTSYYNQNQGD